MPVASPPTWFCFHRDYDSPPSPHLLFGAFVHSPQGGACCDVVCATGVQSRRGKHDYDLVVDKMCGVYQDRVYWWEGVLLLQRLLLNVVATFGTEVPMVRSVATMAVCLYFLSLHISVQPLRHPAGGIAQTTFQVSTV